MKQGDEDIGEVARINLEPAPGSSRPCFTEIRFNPHHVRLLKLVFELAVCAFAITTVGNEETTTGVDLKVLAGFGSDCELGVLLEFDIEVLCGVASGRSVAVFADGPVFAIFGEDGESAALAFEHVHVWGRLVDFDEAGSHGLEETNGGSECNSWSVNNGEDEGRLGIGGGFVSLGLQVSVHLLLQVLAVRGLEGNGVDTGFADEFNGVRGLVGADVSIAGVHTIFGTVLCGCAGTDVVAVVDLEPELVTAEWLHLEDFLVCVRRCFLGSKLDTLLCGDKLAVGSLQGDLWVRVLKLELLVV